MKNLLIYFVVFFILILINVLQQTKDFVIHLLFRMFNFLFFSFFLILFCLIRFHNPSEEIIKGYDVVPQLSDDIQLTVDEYRKKLYEVII